MDIFTFFPWLQDLIIPGIFVIIGILLVVIGSLIPIIGGKIRAIGLLSIVAGVIWYLLSKFINNVFLALPMSALFGIVMGIIVIIIGIILFVDRK